MKYFSGILVMALGVAACPRAEPTKLHGQVEIDEIDLASRLSSRVKEVKVAIGDKVSTDQILVLLDDDLISVRSERAQASLDQATLQKKLTDDATRKEELLQLRAAFMLAQSQWEFAQQSLKRAGILFEKSAISRQQWEEMIAKEKGARAQYEIAKARWDAGRTGARDEQKAIAAAGLVQAQTGLAELSAYDKDLEIKAAMDGIVQAIHAKPGELVPQGFPLVTVLDHEHPRLSFYVTEDRLGRFRQGQTYSVMIPALNHLAIKAELVRIQVLPSVLTQVVTEERQARDIRSFELTLKPLDASLPLQAGMTAILNAGEGS